MAKSQVEGITIEFEGNTIKFDESVDGIKKALNILKKEKTVLDKEFKKTKDIETLSKSLDNLKRQQELAERSAEMLAEKVSELANAGKTGTKEFTAFQSKWAQMRLQATTLGQKIDDLSEKLAKLREGEEPIQRLADKFEDLGNKAGNVGTNIRNIANTFEPISNNAQKVLKSSISNIIDFESSFANVKKTIDETDATSYEDLALAIRQVATEIPTTASEFAEIAAMAGQMGVSADEVVKFSKAMVDLGNSTNINALEASETIAQLYNVMGKGGDFSDIEAFSSAIVELGNNTATTEKDIVEMASNIGAASTRVGMTESEILGLAATLSSLGLDKGGASAISRVMTKIDMAVATNSSSLETWAETADMTVKDFSRLWEEDATKGLGKFIQGLANAKGEGENLNRLLDDLGIVELRQIDTVSRLTNANEQLAIYTEMSNNAFSESVALSEEANKRYETTESRIQVVKNKITEFSLVLGEELSPTIDKVVEIFDTLTERLKNLTDNERNIIINTMAFIAILSPLLMILANVIIRFSNLSTAIGGLLRNEKIVAFLGKITANGTSLFKVLGSLFKVIKSFINPLNAIIAIIAIAYATNDNFRDSINSLASTLWEMLAPVLAKAWELFKELWGIIENVWGIVVELIEVISDLFVVFKDSSAFDVVIMLFQFVLDIVYQVIEAIKLLIGWIKDMIGWVRSALDWLSNLFSKQDKAVNDMNDTINYRTGGKQAMIYSGGYGAMNSGGFASGGVTLNASFNVSSNNISRADVRSWASWLADDINNELGRRIK